MFHHRPHCAKAPSPLCRLALCLSLALGLAVSPAAVLATETTAPQPAETGAVIASDLPTEPTQAEPAPSATALPPQALTALKNRNPVGPMNLPLSQALPLSDTPTDIHLDLADIGSSMLSVWLVDEAGRVQVLADKMGNQSFEPATSSKLVTALLAYDRLADRLDEKVTLEAVDFQGLEGARVVGFVEGEVVRIADLFYGAIIASGGDATQALARLAYGSEEAFVDQMNDMASKLGLSGSHFSNSTGLSAPGNKTTTHDLATLMALAATRPVLVQMMMTPRYTTTPSDAHPRGIEVASILFQDIANQKQREPKEPIYIQGGRPGWSPNAQYTMTAFTRMGGKLAVVVTAGAANPVIRFNDSLNLFHSLIATTHSVVLLPPGEGLLQLPLVNGNRSQATLYAADPDGLRVALPQILTVDDVKVELSTPASLSAPLEAGTVIGKVSFAVNEQVLAEQSLIVNENYSRQLIRSLASFFSGFYQKSHFLFTLLFFLLNISLLAFIVILQRRHRRALLAADLARHKAEEEKQRRLAREAEDRRWEEFRKHSFSSLDAHD